MIRFRARPWIHISSADTAKRPTASARVWCSAVKSMPCPGVRVIPESMSANWSWPSARSPAMTSAGSAPAGRFFEISPVKMMSVARPRILGPTTLKATETTPTAMARARKARSGPISRTRRLVEGQKFFALWPGRSPRAASFSAAISAAVEASSPAGVAGACEPTGTWAPSSVRGSSGRSGVCFGEVIRPPPPRRPASGRSPGRSPSSPAARDGCPGRRCGRCPAPGSDPRR